MDAVVLAALVRTLARLFTDAGPGSISAGGLHELVGLLNSRAESRRSKASASLSNGAHTSSHLQANAAPAFEGRRSALLERLSTLQNAVTLSLPNDAFLQRALSLLMEQTVYAYDAATGHDLDLVE